MIDKVPTIEHGLNFNEPGFFKPVNTHYDQDFLGKFLNFILDFDIGASRQELYEAVHAKFKNVKHIAYRRNTGEYRFIMHDNYNITFNRVLWKEAFGH